MNLWHDVRLAARRLAKDRGVTIVVLLTLTLGVGATTTAFALAYSILVRPLPLPDPGRLVWITSYDSRTSDGSGFVYNSNRMSQFLDWQPRLTSFEQLAAWSGTAAPDVYTVTGAGTPERVNGLRVTQQLLPMLGADPVLGRLFAPGEDDVRAAPTVVLSHGYWQRRFDARPDIIGQSIRIENTPHSVIGVVSSDFALSGSVFAGAPIDLFLPLERNPASDDFGYFMTVVGRLRREATINQVQAELTTAQITLAADRPEMATVVQKVTQLAMPVSNKARSPVLLLLGGIACVLLIACANLANLLLVRASGRYREWQIRAALGATRGQVLRQTLTESGVLSTLGAAGGIALAAGLTRIVRGATWLDLPRLPETEVGWAGGAFALAVCILTTLIFGSVPLLHVRRRDLMDALRPHASVTTDRRATHAQLLALVAQVAFALVLTVTASLLLRSLIGLLRIDPGFQPRGVVAMRVDPAGRLAPAARLPFFNRLLESASAVPGVESAALTINLPMDRNMGWDVSLPGQPYDPVTSHAFARVISPDYFRTAGVRIIEGRDFDSRDQRTAPGVMAINQTLAHRLSAMGREPLGATFNVNGNLRQVIAVVADVKHQTLDGDSGREFYIPYMQAPTFFQAYDLVVRAVDPPAVVPAIREAIWRVDPDQAIGTPVELQELIDRTLVPRRVLSWLLGSFAGTALLLAALGVYGVIGYRLAQRTREVAIRVALGAPPWHVTWTVVRETLAFVAIGLVTGVTLALGAGEALREFLYGVAPYDALTLVTACGVTIGAAIAAAYLPARRAGRVDAMAALRAE